MSIVIILSLIILGGVFYGIDVYRKAKASDPSEQIKIAPEEGPVQVAA